MGRKHSNIHLDIYNVCFIFAGQAIYHVPAFRFIPSHVLSQEIVWSNQPTLLSWNSKSACSSQMRSKYLRWPLHGKEIDSGLISASLSIPTSIRSPINSLALEYQRQGQRGSSLSIISRYLTPTLSKLQ